MPRMLLRHPDSAQGMPALVEVLYDQEDARRVCHHRWRLMPNGYVAADIKGRLVYLHRFIAEPDDGQVVDHINRDRLDNRRSNLRCLSQGLNNLNRSTPVGASGVRNVRKVGKRWQARVRLDGREHNLGTYRSQSRAAEAVAKFKKQRGL